MKNNLSGCDRRMNERVQIEAQNLEIDRSESAMGQRIGECNIHSTHAAYRPYCSRQVQV